MVRVHGCGGEHVQKIDGRTPVLVTDYDGSDTYVHFLALAPRGVGLDKARDDVTEKVMTAARAFPDEWTYDDVKQLLSDVGYKCLPVAVWEETQYVR